MSKLVRNWVMGGALAAAALVGCRHADSVCPTCGHSHVTASNGMIYENSVSSASAPAVTNPGAPMPMPSSSSGVRVIDTTGAAGSVNPH